MAVRTNEDDDDLRVRIVSNSLFARRNPRSEAHFGLFDSSFRDIAHNAEGARKGILVPLALHLHSLSARDKSATSQGKFLPPPLRNSQNFMDVIYGRSLAQIRKRK